MPTEQTILLIVIIVSLAILSFTLGYTGADTKERRAKSFIKNQRNHIGQWVQRTWPNEHAAFNAGHEEGYQKGILQAHDLEQDTISQDAEK